MSDNVATVTSYDLISLNNYALPDVTAGKGTVTITPNPKYTEYECEDGGKVIDVINDTLISGTVEYSGLLQTELAAISSHMHLVSTMTIYNPLTGATKTFTALCLVGEVTRLIHDAGANAWTYSFTFEEIGNA